MSFQTFWPLLILPLPLLVYYLMPAAKQNDAALHVPFYSDLLSLSNSADKPHANRPWRIVLFVVIWLLLVIACCRPVYIGEPMQLDNEARDLLLAVDISGSMEERDMTINDTPVMRIDSVKKVLSEFINKRHGDRLGLILFADNAYLQAPLTFDTQAVNTLLNEAQLGFAGQQTAIGDAIGLAIKRLVMRPAASRTLILLTDGANNAGNVEPLDAAKLAMENGISIHTIGVGADRIKRRGFWGTQIVNPSRQLDEQSLKAIAAQTGGQYFRARNTEELSKIYNTLDAIERVEQEQQTYRPVKQLFYYPLSAALGLLIFWLAWLSLNEIVRSRAMQASKNHSNVEP
jgi:Ca-activated chloride channel family protein